MYLLKLLAIALVSIMLTVSVYGICLLLSTAVQSRSRRPEEPGFPYIYVDDDGGARQLDAEERDYLSTEFHPGDGGRPYIKAYYEALTPDGKMRGFLLRRQLPKHIPVNG
jgi:hypothetical protein